MSIFPDLQALRPLIAKCSACGLCLHACPTFAQTGIETDSPRGRLLLTSALLADSISPAQAAASLARCLLCGRCDRACPAQVPLLRIFFAARQYLPLKLAHKRLFRSLALKASIQDFLQPPLSLLSSLLPKVRARKLAPLPLQPFRQETETPSNVKNTVLLFAGCIARRFFPDLARACAAALAKHGCAVMAPPDLVCCGRPLAVQGKNSLAAIRRNLAALRAYDFNYLVSPCPGCLSTFRQLWPHAPGLSATERQEIEALAAKCLDINEFLAQKAPESAIGSARGIWWHRPCLMSAPESDAARRIIGEAGEILASQDPACCGAPLFCLKRPAAPSAKSARKQSDPIQRLLSRKDHSLSQSLAAAIRQSARAAHADCIAVGCPGCKLALQYGGSGRQETPVLHSIEIYMRKRGDSASW